jgi:DNA-binding MarR family transcriptional regulator
MKDRDDLLAGTAPYILDDQVGFLLRLVSQRHAAIFQARMQADLTPMQFSALIRLAETPGCSQNRLGRLTGMDAATIKGVVDRLVAKGLIALTPDPADRRRTLIALAPDGAALIDTLRDLGHLITAETLAPLTPAEQAHLLHLLRKMT